jgi:hypothetical protein
MVPRRTLKRPCPALASVTPPVSGRRRFSSRAARSAVMSLHPDGLADNQIDGRGKSHEMRPADVMPTITFTGCPELLGHQTRMVRRWCAHDSTGHTVRVMARMRYGSTPTTTATCALLRRAHRTGRHRSRAHTTGALAHSPSRAGARTAPSVVGGERGRRLERVLQQRQSVRAHSRTHRRRSARRCWYSSLLISPLA